MIKKRIISLIMLITIILSIGTFEACAASGQDIVNDLINNYVGKYQYVLNTHGPNTFDCTGLVHYVFKKHGINVPYTTRDNWKSYGKVITDVNQLKSGDILLFGSSHSNLNHAGVYDANGGYIIQALNEKYDIMRNPKLSEWMSSSGWNSNGSNQFQYAIRVFESNSTDKKPAQVPSSNLQISNTNKTLRWKELNDSYDKTTEELQKCLNYIMNSGLKVDGIYGIKTHDAVKDFQGKYGLKVDGDAGPQTLNKVNEVLKGIETGHKHEYSSVMSESSHPHKEYKKCKTCGDIQYTGSNAKLSSCTTCYPIKEEIIKIEKFCLEHDFVKKYNTSHPHKEYKECKECGEIEYTGDFKYVANCTKCEPEEEECSHSYKTKYENAHPHKIYKECKYCDEIKYTGDFKYVANCTKCESEEEECSHSYKIKYEKNHPHKAYRECTKCGETKQTSGTEARTDCEECFPSETKTTITLQIGNPIMYVNEKAKEIDASGDVAPVILNDRTLLPIRAIMEEFGADIVWDAIERKVSIYSSKVIMEFWIGNEKSIVNDKEFSIGATPVIINGRTYMPLRFISEQLGLKVEWDETERTITITN